jgi:catechol 2,3-dioxygenase-like lactoylglutathione lyase family enzyme
MTFRTSDCVALGVDSARVAADHYKSVLGFEEGKSGSNWIEVRSGALRLFLCEDEVKVPCFDIQVEDVEAARIYLEGAGWAQVDIAPGDVFMRDPFGYTFCISQREA